MTDSQELVGAATRRRSTPSGSGVTSTVSGRAWTIGVAALPKGAHVEIDAVVAVR